MESNYMYGTDPIDEMFNIPYKQHTNFDKQSVEVLNSKAFVIQQSDKTLIDRVDGGKFGNGLVFNFDTRDSEMIGNLILMIHLPDISEYLLQWTNDIGNAIIDSIKIINGDEELATYSSEYLHLYSLLNLSSSKRNGLNKMTGHYNSTYSLNGKSRVLYIPIPFMENQLDKQYFPAFLANSHTFQIKVSIKPINKLTYIKENQEVRCVLNTNNYTNSVGVTLQINNTFQNTIPPLFKVKLLYDKFYLTTPEKLMFMTGKGNLLYQYIQQKQVPMDRTTKSIQIQLDFVDTISYLIVSVVPNCSIDRNTYFEYVPLNTIKLILNGIVINRSNNKDDKLSAAKYRYIQPCINIPTKWVYVIPFCISCAYTQPSGYFTFDGKQKSVLIIDRDKNVDLNCTVTVHAVTYKKLQFENAMISYR